MKSPMFLRLENMINTLGQFRKEYDGDRVPKYEVAFLAKKAKDEERKRREQKRIERQQRKEEIANLQKEHEMW